MSKIFYYCQHVLGIGHLFRSLEICKALNKHEVVLITGGPRADLPVIPHVMEYRLPGLRMDEGFKSLQPLETGLSIDEIKIRRKGLLLDLFKRESPDFLFIELYPFGRKAFRFELDPVLEKIANNRTRRTKAICSLRDILVEKRDSLPYEERVIKILNNYFHALLVHSDPKVITLSRTFSKIKEISIPCVYTGFVSSKPFPGAGDRLRERLGLEKDDILIIASAGGGKVGFDLLESVICSLELLEMKNRVHAYIFTGPLMESSDFQKLEMLAGKTAKVFRFTDEFLSFLAAADLSVSMAGYNTCMNILESGVPALVWPFKQNKEQRLRAEEFSQLVDLKILDENDLIPSRLAKIMEKTIKERKGRKKTNVDLNGAENTAKWFDTWTGFEG